MPSNSSLCACAKQGEFFCCAEPETSHPDSLPAPISWSTSGPRTYCLMFEPRWRARMRFNKVSEESAVNWRVRWSVGHSDIGPQDVGCEASTSLRSLRHKPLNDA